MSAASRRRAKDVRKAHRQGFTYSGFKFKEAGGAEALAERSQRGLQKQAQREVKSSYAPLDSELTRREEKVKALDAKRAADEQVYKDWLVQQQNAIRSNAETANAKLQGMMAEQKKALQERLKAAGAAAQAAGIQPHQQAGVAEANANAETRQTQGEQNVGAIQGLANSQLGATQSNSLAFTAQQAAKRQADTLEQLAEVSDLRTKTALQQAADQQKRIAELLEGEVQKSQIRIAGAQFGIKETNDAAKERQASRDKAAGRRTTERGQDKTAANQEAARAQRDSQKRADFIEKHGITPEQWNNYSPKRKQRIINQGKMGFGTKGKKGGLLNGGASPKQLGTANNTVNGIKSALTTGGKFGEEGATYPGDLKKDLRAKEFGGKPVTISNWLQSIGTPEAVANAAVFLAIYKNSRRLPKSLRRKLAKYAVGLPN